MAKKRAARREMLPLARTQLKIVTLVCLPLVLACIIVAVVQTYFFLTSLQSSDSALRAELAAPVLRMSLWVAAITLFVMVPIFSIFAVWLSYRIVGPMRRFATELKSIGQGKLAGKFWFRKGDELVFVAEALSEMKVELARRTTACRDAAVKVEELSQRLDANSPPADDLQKAAAELKQHFEAFELEESDSPTQAES